MRSVPILRAVLLIVRGGTLSIFERAIRRVILPRANQLQLAVPGDGCSGYCNNGRGPFETDQAAFCYFICQVPMHYASYQAALEAAYPDRADPLPRQPLIVDLGCGPGTTLFALFDWVERRRGTTEVTMSYIGIDAAAPLLRLADSMLDSERIRECCRITLCRSIEALTEVEIRSSLADRDGVIFALSYVLHQKSLGDMTLLAAVLKRIRAYSVGMPTWLLLQDANFPDRPNRYTEIWPEQRLNLLVDHCNGLGYNIRAHYSDKVLFRAPRMRIAADGKLVRDPVGAMDNVCRFFQRIA